MANTVAQSPNVAGRTAPIDEERLSREARKALNLAFNTTRTVQTDGAGGLVAIWTDDTPMRPGTDAVVEAEIKGAGVAAPTVVFAAYKAKAMFARGSTGAASQNGATTAIGTAIESDAAIAFSIGVDADSTLFVKVDDGAVASMDWKAWITVRRDT